MDRPTATPDLLDRVRKSGLVSPARLQAVLAGVGAPRGRDLLDALVAARLLTRFQAERLAAGQYKGFILGSYTVLDRLGSGGGGDVFLAEHVGMRRLAALKVLRVPAGSGVARERFLREARTTATLDHPNIVRVFDLNAEGKLLYLVMEYVEGAGLDRLVDADRPLAPAAAADYARQVALGLQHAHEHGFVHRDVKPSNLLVDRTGTVRILDLGLVRQVDDLDSRLTARLVGRNTVLGTADFLAPEQAVDSSTVDIRADVYSLGATLYALLTGRPLFPGGRPGQKLEWLQSREPVPVNDGRPDIPAGLAAVVHSALAKDRDRRFQTPRAMAQALAPFCAGPVPPDPRLIPAPPPRPHHSAPPQNYSITPLIRPPMHRLSVPAPESDAEDTSTPTPTAGTVPSRAPPRPVPAVVSFDTGLTRTPDLARRQANAPVPQVGRPPARLLVLVAVLSGAAAGLIAAGIVWALFAAGVLRP